MFEGGKGWRSQKFRVSIARNVSRGIPISGHLGALISSLQTWRILNCLNDLLEVQSAVHNRRTVATIGDVNIGRIFISDPRTCVAP